MTRIAYVTDLAPHVGGGGSCAVNWNAYDQVKRHFDATYVGPIIPHPAALDVWISKVRRKIFRLPGKFAYFSPSTLSANAQRVESGISGGFDAIVFRSGARWCRARVDVPYFVYLDAVFHTFFHNTFREEDFLRSDFERIFEEEARFLENAAGVFFESKWGMQKAKEAYSLRGATYSSVGRGGALVPPARDIWDGRSKSIVTVAMNFLQKGGDVVLEAFTLLRQRFPDLTWHIVGGRPPSTVDTMPGVTWEGILDPGKPDEREALERILANAFLLLHPTREDTSPLVITEAAYFGCPSISINRFAIPELVINGVTGTLVESPEAGSLERAVTELLENPQRYGDMRRNARAHALANFSWDKVGNAMADRMSATLNMPRSA
jgi:glycosyltransferase involved in cell wall biosynthesis